LDVRLDLPGAIRRQSVPGLGLLREALHPRVVARPARRPAAPELKHFVTNGKRNVTDCSKAADEYS
jgi:hypothetical protein